MLKKFVLMLVLAIACSTLGKPLIAQVSPNQLIAPTEAFALPVTSDTGGYRKFDAKVKVRGVNSFHTGDDYFNRDLKALATTCGVVVAKVAFGSGDHGLGNTLIIQHNLGNTTVFSLYAHLKSFAPGIGVNSPVDRGQQIGTIGKTGKGSNGIVHLHFELKKRNVLSNPDGFGSVAAGTRYGYVPIKAGKKTASSATDYGYFKPSPYYANVVAFCSR